MEEVNSREGNISSIEKEWFRCDFGHINFKYPQGYKGTQYRFLSCPNAEIDRGVKPLTIRCRYLGELCKPCHAQLYFQGLIISKDREV